jgi:hypothetical protein
MEQFPVQPAETSEDDLSSGRNSKEFLSPTAHELAYIIHRIPGARRSSVTDERANRFAHLLNRGSSLE